MQLRRPLKTPAALALLALVPAVALAHTGADPAASGFLTGLRHPLAGADHVLAMLAVGMWGAQLGSPAIWVLPVAFPQVMALGGVLGILALPLPSVELGITLSVLTLGSMIAFDRRPPLFIAALLVGIFAVFHGYAHGAELVERTRAVAYSAGFVCATGAIHLAGIGIGFVVRIPHGTRILRAAGSAIAVAGLVFTGQLLLG